MYALQRFNKLFKDEENSRSQQTFERLTLNEGRIADLRKRLMNTKDTRLKSPRERARQSEAKRKQAL